MPRGAVIANTRKAVTMVRRTVGLIGFVTAIVFLPPSEAQDRPRGYEPSAEQRAVLGASVARDRVSEYDTPEVLRRVLKREPYASLSDAEYAELLERTAREFPESRVAHEALAFDLIGHRGEKGPDFARGVQELQRAAELSFRDGVVRYEPQLPSYLALLGDEAGLHRYAEDAFRLLPEGRERYSVYLYYAHALAQLKNPLAHEMFAKAIATRPTGQLGAYEFYVRYLLAEQDYDRLLLLLTPAVLGENPFMREYFSRARCEALKGLQRTAEAKKECSAKSGRPFDVPRRSVGGARGDDEDNGAEKTNFPHNNSSDDCRYATMQSLYHPGCNYPGCWKYNLFVWQLAEIAINEARDEAPGAQRATTWTVRDRATRATATPSGIVPGCGFAGANTGCTSLCPWPQNAQACTLQKTYCCAIHATEQFNRTHVLVDNIPRDVIEAARRVVDGELADPVSGYVPAGGSGCQNWCDIFGYCNTRGSSYDYAPEGPTYFYGNANFGNTCLGYMPGITTACAIVADETCGGGGAIADNCFLRQTRKRVWTSGFTCVSNCSWNGTDLILTGPTGHATKLPTEMPAFKSGGKAVVVNARLYSGTGATLRVRLIDQFGTIVQEFGTRQVSSTTLADFEFQSDKVLAAASCHRVWMLNEGGGVLAIRSVTMRD